MNIAALRAGLAEDIKTAIPRTTPYVPDQVNPPCAFVEGADITFDDTFEGRFTAEMGVVILMSSADARSGQDNLDKIIDDVYDAVTSTLGGVAESAHVLRLEGYGGNFNVGESSYIGARMVVEVFAI